MLFVLQVRAGNEENNKVMVVAQKMREILVMFVAQTTGRGGGITSRVRFRACIAAQRTRTLDVVWCPFHE